MSDVQFIGIVVSSLVGLLIVVVLFGFVWHSAFEEDERWAQWTLVSLVIGFVMAALLAAFGVFG